MKLLSGTKKKQRQANALKRLENQLKTESKTPKKNQYSGSFGAFQEPLTELDIKRINSEIAILKSRI